MKLNDLKILRKGRDFEAEAARDKDAPGELPSEFWPSVLRHGGRCWEDIGSPEYSVAPGTATCNLPELDNRASTR